MPSPNDKKEDTLEGVPEELLEKLDGEVSAESVLAAAPYDLDAHGRYLEGYLFLSGAKLGDFVLRDGQWAGRWLEIAPLSDAEIVDGLGMKLLRLLADGRATAEFRFTLRHARAVAKLHRRLEKQITGAEGEEAPEEAPHAEEKKTRCDKCGGVIPAWSEVCPACMSRRKVLFRLLDFIKPYKVRAISGAACAVLMTILSLVQPYLIQPMVDVGLGRAGHGPDWGVFVTFVFIMASLVLITSIGRGFQARMMAGLGSRIARDVRNKAYGHLHRLSLSFFSRKQTGNLVTRITTDSDRLWDFVAFTVVEAGIAMLTITGVGVAMFLMSWRLAVFVLLPLPVMTSLMVFFHKRMHGLFRKIMHRWSQMTSVVSDALPGVRVIKAFGQERREVGRFSRRNTQVYEEELNMVSIWTVFGPVMMFCTHLGGLLIWLIGGAQVVHDYYNPPPEGAPVMTLGTLFAFQAFMWMFYRPIHMVAHMDRMFTRAAASAQRIFEVLDTEPGIFSRRGATSADDLHGRIEMRNVSFSYDGIRKVLKNVNLRIAPGEMIGLAGPSGGGKTTMVNLICRFYDALEGRILIDGVDVKDYDLESLRKRIGVVLQEPFLFHGTVAENIAYGRPEATMEEIIQCARAANAHEFIVGFPDAYDTVVGERGHTLSGGERQRISIGRAILNNPKLLILDEATSSVDTEAEKLIQEALDRLIANRTTIAIAHRLSTLRKADRLVILEKGLVIEEGTHEELAGKEDGLYAKLLRMQTETQSIMAI